MRRPVVGLALAALLAAALPASVEARTCPCAYPAAKRIYQPARGGLRVVINPVYPFYPYLRSSWRLYWGYPRYYVYRSYRPVRRVQRTVVAPVTAAPPIDK
jgi:hypothetical protein